MAESGDAYVRQQRIPGGVRWRFGTAVVEKRVQWRDGHLALIGFTDRQTAHEYLQGDSDILDFVWDGRAVSGRDAWVLDDVETTRLSQGELRLRLKLHTAGIAVVKNYLLYPKESIVQEWLQITNLADRPATLTDPAALTMRMLHNEVPAVDFTYMTGFAGEPARFRFYTIPAAGLNKTFEGYKSVEYSPIQVYQNRETQRGVFVGWDYLGLWRSSVGAGQEGPIHADFRVARYRRALAPAESVETPKAFTGVFHGDFDEMGQQLLDYQYRYKWDYTRAPYFPGTEMEGNWIAGSWWGGSWAEGRTGGILDPVSTYRKVFHLADVFRTIGTDLYWRDNGWWDREGDWNGPNWAETGRYLAQYGMQQIIYAPIQDVDSRSAIAQAHPEWVVGDGGPGAGLLDQSRSAVIDWQLQTLESMQRRWGNFQWRKDWTVTDPRNDPSRLLAQDQGFRRLVQTFLDRHPGMAFHGCDGGGNDLGYEMLRMGVSWSMEDGYSDHLRAYYASYIYPPDKLENLPDVYLPKNYTKEKWRALLANRFPMMGETTELDQLEGIRLLFDIYHYLTREGVVGRWGFVYHPAVVGDSADWYLERLSGDHRRGILTIGHALTTPITIYPKGLRPKERYHISFQESSATTDQLGADLMTSGIRLPHVPAGEIVYLNLPLHPGSPTDHTPPGPPSGLVKQVATHMDYSGVALRWRPGRDDNWVSYYKIYRNGVLIDKVAKGTYYFDHALGADLMARYAVTTVDGSGNESALASAGAGTHGATPGALVVDDTSHALTYTGSGWKSRRLTISNSAYTSTGTAGDAVSYTFTGSRLTWYGHIGPENGVAAVYVDGQLDRLVDMYNVEDIPNVAVYGRLFPKVETHTIKIVNLGAKTGEKRALQLAVQKGWGDRVEFNKHASVDALLGAVAQDTAELQVVVDGLQVDQTATRDVTSGAGGFTLNGSGWQRASATSASKGAVGRGSLSRQAGDEAVYTFVGSGVTWEGRYCVACGMADVYVDGRLETTVETYSPPIHVDASLGSEEQRQVPVFTRQWPTRGQHTLKIVIRPDANLWATGRDIYIDALHVTP